MSPFEIWLYRLLIITGIAVSGWMIRRFIGKVDDLTTVLAKLNVTLQLQHKDMKGIKSHCESREQKVDECFKEHDIKINDHEKRIYAIEQDHEKQH